MNSVEQAIASLPLPPEWVWQVDVRTRRRTLGIEIDADGGVLFAVPASADPGAVAAAVRSRLPRLAEEVRRRQGRTATVKDLASGTRFAYLGRRYRLRIVAERAAGGVRLHRGQLEMKRPRHPAEGGRWLVDWYADRGSRWLSARLPPLAERLGVVPVPVTAQDLGERCGSCRSDGGIAVHWAVLQLHPQLVDYVLLHELVHLVVPGHGAAFRRQLRLALPDADERGRWFEAEERHLWRGAVR